MTSPVVPNAFPPPAPLWQSRWPASPAEGDSFLGPTAESNALAALQQALDLERPAFSIDRASNAHVESNTVTQAPAPSLEQDVGLSDTANPQIAHALRAMYGDSFPLAGPTTQDPRGSDWAAWASQLWSSHSAGVQIRLHLVERNRLFRKGVQWISAIGIGPWREPPKPREAARVVDNMIASALDQRVQILAEQRPGFRVRPENQDQKNLKKAEAQQQALEYQYDQQSMRKIMMEAAYWAGTDGVSFLEMYWDTDGGPWDELFLPQFDQQGNPVYDQNGMLQGQPSPPMPLGEVACRVRRMDQVRVASNGSANTAPYYWVIRDAIPQSVAVREYGPDVLDNMDTGPATASAIDVSPAMRMGYQFPTPDELLRNVPTVDRFTVYCDKSDFLKQGLQVVVVGRKLVNGPMPLPWGVVPMVRWSDGSTDPSFFNAAIMEDWIDSQMRVNVLKSKWVEAIRLNAGGKVMARENAISSETLVGGTTTVIGVKGQDDIRNIVQPFPNFSVGADTEKLLEIEKTVFENKTGWNDVSRGSFAAEQSGRAILAIREQLERIFAPLVNAASEAMEEWSKISIAAMRWGYTTPRRIAVEGQGRPDLARALTSEDFDGVANILIDPETLMPLPRALRLFILDDLYAKGLMSQQEYRRRLPFAFTQSIENPDQDHYARANRSIEYLRETVQMGMPNANPPTCPILWQDNEAIHQEVLERQVILQDDPQEYPQALRAIAFERWMMYAQQQAMKQGMMAPQPQPGAPQGGPQGGQQQHGGGGPAKGPNLPVGNRPFQGTNPGVSAGTAQMMLGNNQQAGAHQFDMAARQ
jgi:hypothetical protein